MLRLPSIENVTSVESRWSIGGRFVVANWDTAPGRSPNCGYYLVAVANGSQDQGGRRKITFTFGRPDAQHFGNAETSSDDDEAVTPNRQVSESQSGSRTEGDGHAGDYTKSLAQTGGSNSR